MSKTVRELHNQAMIYAQEALVAHYTGNKEDHKRWSTKAYELEAQALALVPAVDSSEPTLSILRLSAASLAFQCDKLAEAKSLVSQGLSGTCYDHTRERLISLQIKIHEKEKL